MSSLPPPYMINFGISPYFKCQLIKEIHVSPYSVVSYDESLNRIVQGEQKWTSKSAIGMNLWVLLRHIVLIPSF